MDRKLSFASRSPLLTIFAAASAAVLGLTTLWGVSALFQRHGAPMERLLAAERACAQLIYVSEREACMREWLAAAAREKANRKLASTAAQQPRQVNRAK